MIVKAENTIDKQDVKAMVSCSHSSLKFMLILLASVFTLFLVFCIAISNTGKNSSYCIVGVIWCAVVYAYSFMINPVLAYRSFKKKYSADATVQFKFNANNLAISIDKSEKRKNYKDMFKVYETEDYFFIYTKRNESYIMKKSGIQQGKASDAAEIFAKELSPKFIRRMKTYD